MTGRLVYSVDKLMAETRRLAADYRRTTGQPLPVTSEIARYDACRLLDLDPVTDPLPGDGYDAIGRVDSRRPGRRIQIKGRAVFDERKSNQRIGQLKLDRHWDSVVLVLLDEQFEPYAIYEATRDEVAELLGGEQRRSKRGAMTIGRFRVVAQLVWSREEGVIDDEVWCHG